jgi:ubiquinone/menaquinone biosynthesis C-methylase UbiE
MRSPAGRAWSDERLDNVSIKLGAPDDPRLPAASFDRIFMVHMYHEVTEPYAFLWHMRPALAEGGQVIVVDVDRRPTSMALPRSCCSANLKRVGFRLVEFDRKPEIAGYYAQFEAVGRGRNHRK